MRERGRAIGWRGSFGRGSEVECCVGVRLTLCRDFVFTGFNGGLQGSDTERNVIIDRSVIHMDMR